MTESNNKTKVCVIGAGQAGLVACKYLLENEIPYTCFEKGSCIGGMWNRENDNGMSSAYENLELNTSKRKTTISGFSMPDEYPDYISIHQMYEYLSSFVEHFNLKKHINFNTAISNITKTTDGLWKIETHHGQIHDFSHVIVASGANCFPNMPKTDYSFSGTVLHSKEYKSNKDFKDQNVLIVGLGSSGAEIACDLASVVKKLYVSVKKMPMIMPKYLLGKPADHWVSPASSYLPPVIQQNLFKMLIWLTRGSQKKYKIPSPELNLSEHNPTVSNHFLPHCKKGLITIKPTIKKVQSQHVLFADGSCHEIDTIIYATGYQCRFPFFPEGFLSTQNNPLPLYKKIYHPSHFGLYFLGFIAPRGPVIPLVDQQMHWITKHIQSKLTLPSIQDMWKSIETHHQSTAKSTTQEVTENPLQVEMYPYMRLLQADV